MTEPQASFQYSWPLEDEQATAEFGARLSMFLRVGDWVGIAGSLGAGKTTLVRALIRALHDHDVEVPSPTFTLVQVYERLPAPVWHVDLYRLERPEEAWELGLEDAFAEAITLIEWPERLAGALPRGHLEVRLEYGSENGTRSASLCGGGDWPQRLEGIRDAAGA